MNPLSLSELKEMEKHLPSRNVKSEEDKVQVENEVMDSLPDEGKTKMCTKCGVTKTLNGFKHEKRNKKDGHAAICKDCFKIVRYESLEKSAMILFDEIKGFMKIKKNPVDLKDLSKKTGRNEPNIYQSLRILVDKGTVIKGKLGRKNVYSLPQTAKKEEVFDFNVKTGHDKTVKTGCNGYDAITDALPESKPKNELPRPFNKIDKMLEDEADCKEYQKTIDELKTAKLQLITANKGIERFKEENEGLNIQIKDLIEHNDTLEHLTSDLQSEIKLLKEDMEVNEAVDPITQEDLNNLEEIGIKSYPMQKSAPEDRITEVVDIAYSGAESIQINPENHEVIIKMKG
jgi:predicted transcriptional regulator